MLNDIQYCIKPAKLAWVLIAHSDQGVCAVLLNAKPEQLPIDLAQKFPQAELRPADLTLEQLAEQIIQHIDNPHSKPNFELNPRGTDFEQRVWRAIQSIPAGQTLSYQAIAIQLGKPKAFRAVAKACGANAIAILIPCHRVVRKSGGLSGYRWGLPLKQALLDSESNMSF